MDSSTVQPLLESSITKYAVPGAQLGLLRGAERLVASAGIRDLRDNLPVVDATAFHAGSIAKALTGLVILDAARQRGTRARCPLRCAGRRSVARDPTHAAVADQRQAQPAAGERRAHRGLRRTRLCASVGACPRPLLLLQRGLVGARPAAAAYDGTHLRGGRHRRPRSRDHVRDAGRGSRRTHRHARTGPHAGALDVRRRRVCRRLAVVGDGGPAARLRGAQPPRRQRGVRRGRRDRPCGRRPQRSREPRSSTRGEWAGQSGTGARTRRSAGPATPAATGRSCGASRTRTPPSCCSRTAQGRCSAPRAAARSSTPSSRSCWSCSRSPRSRAPSYGDSTRAGELAGSFGPLTVEARGPDPIELHAGAVRAGRTRVVRAARRRHVQRAGQPAGQHAPRLRRGRPAVRRAVRAAADELGFAQQSIAREAVGCVIPAGSSRC